MGSDVGDLLSWIFHELRDVTRIFYRGDLMGRLCGLDDRRQNLFKNCYAVVQTQSGTRS